MWSDSDVVSVLESHHLDGADEMDACSDRIGDEYYDDCCDVAGRFPVRYAHTHKRDTI